MAHAFTIHYNQIVNKLKSPITIIGNDQQIDDVALWDTGATCNCISQEIADKLGLVATGYCFIQTPSGQATKKTYLVDIVLPNSVRINGIAVTESEIGKQGIGLLIGMDIINLGDFSVSNYNGKTMFGFRLPSVEDVDFIKEESKAISALQKTQATEEDTSDKKSI